MDTTLARVAQAALQQRVPRTHGLNPDGVLAAAARWHIAQQQQEADGWWRGEQLFMRLLCPTVEELPARLDALVAAAHEK